jgi:hypothetical protein
MGFIYLFYNSSSVTELTTSNNTYHGNKALVVFSIRVTNLRALGGNSLNATFGR